MDKLAFLLRELAAEPALTQRALAFRLRSSLGSVNALCAEAKEKGLLTETAAPDSSSRRPVLPTSRPTAWTAR